MEDDKIVALYWQRDESAIRQTEQKYGHYLTKIAYNILTDIEDSEESVNDTYLYTWNSIPPQRPKMLSTYLAKIIRRVSIDIFRKRHRDKRRISEYTVSISELEECLSSGNTTEQEVDLHLLSQALNDYLRTLPSEARNTFICRYYFMDSIRDVASYYGMTESKVKSMLHRTRIGLKIYLQKEGICL